MPNRFANWGQPPDESPGDARYRTGDDDPAGGGNFVVAERLDSNGNSVDVLLEWDDTAETWQNRGPVEMNGNDLTGVGALDAQSVNTASLSVESTRDATASLYQTDGDAPDPSSITITETKLGDVAVGSIDMDLSGSVSVDQRWVISISNSYLQQTDNVTGSAFVYGNVTNNNLAHFQIERQPSEDRLIILCTRVSGSVGYSAGLSGSYVLF